ncbi:hypothetical protein LCGC14_1054200 [marine sediment metagenome]|uniref:PH domain-containing protein n=1 Tax=marine sediment metagenome TaxID=412755 RepID=A0A0F9QTZ2_9ZZZZ
MDQKKKVIEEMLERLDISSISKHDYHRLVEIQEITKQLVLNSTDPDELAKWQEKLKEIKKVLDKF